MHSFWTWDWPQTVDHKVFEWQWCWRRRANDCSPRSCWWPQPCETCSPLTLKPRCPEEKTERMRSCKKKKKRKKELVTVVCIMLSETLKRKISFVPISVEKTCKGLSVIPAESGGIHIWLCAMWLSWVTAGSEPRLWEIHWTNIRLTRAQRNRAEMFKLN